MPFFTAAEIVFDPANCAPGGAEGITRCQPIAVGSKTRSGVAAGSSGREYAADRAAMAESQSDNSATSASLKNSVGGLARKPSSLTTVHPLREGSPAA